MEKKEKTKIRRMINAVLKNNFINHPLLVECYGPGEDSFKRSYINSVSCSITYFLLKGRCVIAPEYDYRNIESEGEKYPDPQTLYYDKYALDPYTPKTLESIAEILMAAFKENRENVIDATKAVIARITETL